MIEDKLKEIIKQVENLEKEKIRSEEQIKIMKKELKTIEDELKEQDIDVEGLEATELENLICEKEVELDVHIRELQSDLRATQD